MSLDSLNDTVPGDGPAADPFESAFTPVHGYPGGPAEPPWADLHLIVETVPLPEIVLPDPSRFTWKRLTAVATAVVVLVASAGFLVMNNASPAGANCASVLNTATAPAVAKAVATTGESVGQITAPPRWRLEDTSQALSMVAATGSTAVVGNWFSGGTTAPTLAGYNAVDGSLTWSAKVSPQAGAVPNVVVEDRPLSSLPTSGAPTAGGSGSGATMYMSFKDGNSWRVAGIDADTGYVASCTNITDSSAVAAGVEPSWSTAGGRVYVSTPVNNGDVTAVAPENLKDSKLIARSGDETLWSARGSYDGVIGQLGDTVIATSNASGTRADSRAELVGLDVNSGREMWRRPLGADGAMLDWPTQWPTLAPDGKLAPLAGLVGAVTVGDQMVVAYDPNMAPGGGALDPAFPVAVQLMAIDANGNVSGPWTMLNRGDGAIGADDAGRAWFGRDEFRGSWAVFENGEWVNVPGTTLSPDGAEWPTTGGPLAGVGGQGLALTANDGNGQVILFGPAGEIGRILDTAQGPATVAPGALYVRVGSASDNAAITAWEIKP
jgi:hypothetical protein